MKIRLVALLALVAILLAPFAGVVSAQGETVVDVAAKAGNFTTLVAAVEAAGLVDTLKGAGPFTVFAPTDEAFAKLPKIVLDYLMANKELLARVLSYHVVSGEVAAAQAMAMAGQTAKSVEGGDIAISVVGDKVKVNSATVVTADVKASNGIIHAIDSVILPTITLPEVDPLTVQGNILTAGSSTVFPVTRRMADKFREAGFADNIEVASVGTGAGFERFCKAGETDISNASAKIKQSQIDDCTNINRTPVEFYIGIDALAVVVGKDTGYVTDLTTDQIKDVFSGKFKTWNEVNASWPADPIRLFSPGTDSGTFDYFVEHFYAKDKNPILNAPGIQLSEDDNVLVQGVAGTKGAIGYFGFAYYLPNADKLNAVAVDGIAANKENAESGAYPIARPLFIYSDPKIMKDKPQVAAFINFYLTNVDAELGTEAGKIAYFPVPADARNLRNLVWLAATSM